MASADVKCEDLVMVQFDGPIMFVSNEHPYGDESFLRRVHVVYAFMLFMLIGLRRTMWRRFGCVSQKRRLMGL